jgi:SAM-dependent methyltransferase/peptidoglycan/xylan/chitin deacetylase (PgdA/CDA1 family)
MASARLILHSPSLPDRADAARGASTGRQVIGRLRPLLGPAERIVVDVDVDSDLLTSASRGLPEGSARAEAIAARLIRDGVEHDWGEPIPLSTTELLELQRSRGESSIAIMRADPTLVPMLQLGAWFTAGWRTRIARRLALGLARPLLRLVARLHANAAADLAFWSGVRAASTDDEWDALTRRSYVALCYHRLAGELREGQERIDLPPGRFSRHVRLLRRLGFGFVSPDEVVALHRGASANGLRGSRHVVITADDGFADTVAVLSRLDSSTARATALFVPTARVDSTAPWAGDVALASWEDLRALERIGVSIASHGRTHRDLRALDDADLAMELSGSRSDLHEHLDERAPMLAYPNGRHDERVIAAAEHAGFGAAFTTESGRNGIGTHPMCLRRITPKAWDSNLSLLFKATTGEPLPPAWERWLLFRDRAVRRARPIAERATRDLAPGRRLRLRTALAAIEHTWGAADVLRVLDAGCEEGLLALALAERHPGWTIVAADLNTTALERGRANARAAGLHNVHFVALDLTRDLPVASFDVIVLLESLAEIPDDRAALRSVTSALRPDGRLYVHAPDADWQPVLRGTDRLWYRNVRAGYSADELRAAMCDSGLETLEVTPTMRSGVQLAEELRQRAVRGRGLPVQLAALPLMAGVVALERRGVAWGPSRGLFAVGRRP